MFPARRITAGWRLWELPTAPAVFVLSVEALAVAAVAAGVLGGPAPRSPDLFLAALLTTVAVLHAEVTRGAERIRRRTEDLRFVDMTSVWIFPAALLLPPALATATVLVTYAHLYLRVSRPAGTPLYRHLFAAATVLLAVHAVAAVGLRPGTSHEAFGVTSAVLVALLLYAAVSTLLVATAVRLYRPQLGLLRILRCGEIMLEPATLSLGALLAVTVFLFSPLAVLFALLPVGVLGQATLVRQLEAQADSDAKTGLLDAAAWRLRSQRLLQRDRRGGRATGVLVLDLDHFKKVNDRYGHLAGDDVLLAVAGVLRAELRDHDVAGRFGGEEFVVTLGGLDQRGPDRQATEVAERIRRGVGDLRVTTAAGPVAGLSVSVGVATSPRHGRDVRELLAVADTALYAAKRGGRNQVRSPQPDTAPS
ncbi:GGDEF domain-containing protein [Pseudonocardia sp. HH130630-07]|uniref:GGDEF domain-containing protein n=1 Tax=Pseudonocardia sp. HH130630-07 TaxID=1690815 RepID=UPI001E4E0913|nr:GGDEF domain-containing protein [Pseudonocardia sp. HH130630-07]